MLEYEWSLFIRVTLQTPRIRAGRKTRLLEFKAAVWIVAITAFHLPFKDFVMKRAAKLRLGFGVTTDAELRFAATQHVSRQQITISPGGFGCECV